MNQTSYALMIISFTASVQAQETVQKLPYALDGMLRSAAAYRENPCPMADVVGYTGRGIEYEPEANVNAAFVFKLAEMEDIAAQVATEIYGRPPAKIMLMASYQCRRIRPGQRNVSEHALGNAVDIGGFSFDPVDPSTLPEGVPSSLAEPFRVTVLKHWKGSDAVTLLHQQFLHEWINRVISRDGLFHVVLGPGYPGHHNHVHLDAAPYQLISVNR